MLNYLKNSSNLKAFQPGTENEDRDDCPLAVPNATGQRTGRTAGTVPEVAAPSLSQDMDLCPGANDHYTRRRSKSHGIPLLLLSAVFIDSLRFPFPGHLSTPA